VCAAGPSLHKADFSLLKRFEGSIVAVNKALIPLLRNGVVPEWVVALDGLPVVYDSFDDAIVREHKGEIKFLGASVLDPKVVRFALDWSKESYWGNPHMPSGADSEEWNVNVVLELMNSLELLRHGGNAGTMAYLLAKHIGRNPIGLLGFDLCLRPDSTWTKEKAVQYEYFYNPVNGELMALDAPFKAYVTILTDVTSMAWEEGIASLNLSTQGVLYSSRLFPDITLQDFIERPAEDIIEKARKERNEAVESITRFLEALKASQKPMFRDVD